MNTTFAVILIGFISSVVLGMMKSKPRIVGKSMAIILPLIFFFSRSPFGTGNSSDSLLILPFFILFMVFAGLPSFAGSFAGAYLGNEIAAPAKNKYLRLVYAFVAFGVCTFIAFAGYSNQ